MEPTLALRKKEKKNYACTLYRRDCEPVITLALTLLHKPLYMQKQIMWTLRRLACARLSTTSSSRPPTTKAREFFINAIDTPLVALHTLQYIRCNLGFNLQLHHQSCPSPLPWTSNNHTLVLSKPTLRAGSHRSQVLKLNSLKLNSNNLSHWEYESWDLPLHMGSQVLSLNYDVDVYMATFFWRWSSGLVLRVGSSILLDPTLNTRPEKNFTKKQ